MKYSIFLLLLFTAHAYSFEYDFSSDKCDKTNDYLQPQLKEFIDKNPTFFSYNDSCEKPFLLSTKNVSTLRQAANAVDATSLCLYASLQNNPIAPDNCNPEGLDEKGNKKYIKQLYVKCDSPTGDGSRYYQKKVTKNCMGKQKVKNKEGKWVWADYKRSSTTHYGYEAPCVTKELHKVLYKSFLNVAECTGVDKSTWFSILNHESRFQINAGNTHQVYGVGQLTSQAIGEINRRYFEKRSYEYDKKLKKSVLSNVWREGNFLDFREKYAKRKGIPAESDDNPCHRMRGTLAKPFDVETPDEWRFKRGKKSRYNPYASACERAGVPANPLKSLLYSALTHKIDIGKAETLYKTFPKVLKEKFKKHKSKIIHLLARYIYNGGDGAVGSVLKNYFLTKVHYKEKISYLPTYRPGYDHIDVNSFKKEFEEYIQHSAAKADGVYGDKKRELGGYVKGIEQDKAMIEKYLAQRGVDVQCGY